MNPPGDRLGAALLASLRERRPGLQFEGCGGPLLRAAGLTVRTPIEHLGTIGFVEAVASLPRHWALLRRFARESKEGRFQAAVLVDYPGFHLRLGEVLRRAGVPVIQFGAPQLWAWGEARIERLKRAADRVAALLPFEEAWFGQRGVPCTFVGHPTRDRAWPTREAARRHLHLPPDAPVLGIFPGSRADEIDRHWPIFREVARRMLAEGRCRHVVVAATAGGYYPEVGPSILHRENGETVLAAATAILAKSGTTSLEAACAGTPMVVAYRASLWSHMIAQRLLTARWISLPNLILEEPLIPEFWRLPLPVAAICDAVRPLLEIAGSERSAQLAGLARVRDRLGSPGAIERVAAMVLERLPC